MKNNIVNLIKTKREELDELTDLAFIEDDKRFVLEAMPFAKLDKNNANDILADVLSLLKKRFQLSFYIKNEEIFIDLQKTMSDIVGLDNSLNIKYKTRNQIINSLSINDILKNKKITIWFDFQQKMKENLFNAEMITAANILNKKNDYLYSNEINFLFYYASSFDVKKKGAWKEYSDFIDEAIDKKSELKRLSIFKEFNKKFEIFKKIRNDLTNLNKIIELTQMKVNTLNELSNFLVSNSGKGKQKTFKLNEDVKNDLKYLENLSKSGSLQYDSEDDINFTDAKQINLFNQKLTKKGITTNES